MNRKFSTLLAAFLAAGYCMTAEAGIVKITKVETGRDYVVAETGWGGATTGKYYVKSSSGAFTADGNSSTTSAIVFADATAATAGQFQLELVSGDTYYLKQNGNYLYSNPVSGNVELSAASKTPLTLQKNSDGTITLWNSAKTQSLNIAPTGGAGKVVVFADGENKIDLYAYTDKLAAATGQVLKIGNKYLVVNTLNSDAVEVVDEAVYQAYITRGDIESTLWDVDASGKITSQAPITTPANNYLKLTGGTFGFTLVATNNDEVVFEYNNAEDLFGAWSSNVFKPLVLKAGKYALAANATPDATETPVKVALSKSTVAPYYALPQADDYVLADEVNGNEYYLITSNAVTNTGTVKFISQAKAEKAPEMVTATSLDGDEAAQKAAYWKVSKSGPDADGNYHYSFVNKNGVTLSVEGVYDFMAKVPYNKGIKFDGNGLANPLTFNTSSTIITFTASEVSTAGQENSVLGFYKVATEDFSAAELLKAYNTYFDLNLSNKKDGAELEGNPFAQEGLVPMKIVYDKNSVYQPLKLTEATKNEKIFLLKTKNSNDYIILDWDKQWSKEGIDIHVTKGGFKFGTLTADNMLAYINKAYKIDAGNKELADRNLGFAFQFKHASLENEIKNISVVDYVEATEDVYENALKSDDYVKVTADDRAVDAAVQYPVYLTTYETNGVHYLTVNSDLTKVILYASLAKQTLVHGSDAKNNPLNYGYVNIEFVNHEKITYRTEDNKTAYLNGKVLGVDRNGGIAFPAEADKFLFAKPEGQWAVKMTNVSREDAEKGKALSADKDIAFSFTNRENPDIVYSVDRMYSLGDDVYAVESSQKFNNNGYIAGVRRDTMKISNANIKSDKLLTDGYKDLDDAAIKDKQYRIVLNSTSDVNYYVSENHTGNHLLGITTKVAEAANWKLVRMDREAQYDKDGYLKEATDSVYVFNYPQVYKSDKKYYQHTDTLAAVTYALKNTVSNEYLTYADVAQEKDINAMICMENSADFPTHSATGVAYNKYLNSNYRFVIKEKDGELVNILGTTEYQRNHAINFGNKLFGAATNNRVETEYAYTQINSNDLFRLEEVDAPEYVKATQGDVIRLFSEDNNDDVIYENGEFLNLGNISQMPDIKPALYVDTAYVERDGNNRYQYLLVVNPTRVDEVLDNANHRISPDTTYGRFLVNLVDTAVYAYKNGAVHANKYINDKEAGEKLVKTGFVWGFRTGDKLYVTENNSFKKDDARVIDLSTSDFNVAKFAFKYVNSTNPDDKSFKIQTRYVDYTKALAAKDQKDRLESNDGYLKTINGVVVVANGYEKGEVFNLSAESSDPTANGSVSAAVVTVIAGEGNVTIKGAANKEVTVCNVLGQTLATAVLTSDEATIAVPAGIVFVAVEGEAAVKAVVK